MNISSSLLFLSLEDLNSVGQDAPSDLKRAPIRFDLILPRVLVNLAGLSVVGEIAKQQTLYEMTKAINVFIRKEKVPKRELARRLGTSMSQLSRLLDTTNYKKELSRLIEIAAMLNYEFKWEFKKAA